MAIDPHLKIPLNGFLHKLVQDGLLSDQDAQQAMLNSADHKTTLIKHLITANIINSVSLSQAIAYFFGLPWLDISAIEPDSIPTDLVNEKLIRKHNILPLKRRGNRLYLAILDPSNNQSIEEVKFHAGLKVQTIIVENEKLAHLIEQILSAKETNALGDLSDTKLDDLEISAEDESSETTQRESDGDDAPVVRFVNKILLDAITKGASDIHFEPYEKVYRIRLRQDGVLHDVAAPPASLGSRIAARVKIMSQLDISERRLPQDGRFKMTLSRNRSIDFRVNSCPTVYGEKIVMRILDAASTSLNVESLGLAPAQKTVFLKAIRKPQGMILVTGPTGSGKTVSLYTALNILNTNTVNILTVEDPVEIHLTGINQVNINLKAGLTFATALRAFLRQDPDIIMVGEMRDLETVEIGIKAAQTGHLVLSTLHTNSAPETLTRLKNMGVESYNIATSVSLIIAQRLARKLCDLCKKPETIPVELLLQQGLSEQEVASATFFSAVGCEACFEGYKGRSGIYELLPMSEKIGELIMEGHGSIEIARQAKKEGMRSLYDSGLQKVMQGTLSMAELNRVTKD